MARLIQLSIVILLSVFTKVHSQTLRSLAESHHKYMGVGVLPEDFKEAEFGKVVDREFDCMTPGNHMKWDATEPTRGHFTFAEGDIIVNHGMQHGQKIRGHTLVWHGQLAPWVEQGHFNATELRSIMKNHITNVVTHWKGKIYAWDVLNEILNEDGSLRQSVWYKTLGKSYVADAFRFAHEADPAAKLYINDYNVESINKKSTGMLNLIKELKAQGVPVHGAGIQSHIGLGHVPHDFQQNLARFDALGVDVALTELDIAIKMPASAENLAQQAKDFASVVGACVAVPRCVGVTAWGLTDRHSWIPHVSHGANGAALLYDDNYKEKPAFTAVKQALAK